MVKQRRNGIGYTLVEVMIAVAIVGIISSMAATLLTQMTRYWSLTNARAELQREARAAMYVVTRELREAQNATITIDRFNASQPFYSRITFTKIQGTSLSFYQNGNQLIQMSGNQRSILSKNLGYLAFSFPRSDDMTIVSVDVTLQKIIYQGRVKALHMASEKVQVMN